MILEERKKWFYSEQIKPCEAVHKFNSEYAVKNVWPLLRDDKELCEYLPDYEMEKDRWPDRRFFWGVVSTLRREWVD